MKEAFINVNDVPIHVMTCGKWIEESWDAEEKEVVILLPGNPGLTGFYSGFINILYENFDKKIPVWAIGHAGHDMPPSSSVRKLPERKTHPELYNLSGQVTSKIEFIKKYVPADVKIHLIGHSIGSWMILQLLKKSEIKSKVIKCYLIFPTIERMAKAPDGFKLTNFVFRLLCLWRFVLCLLAKLPTVMLTIIIYIVYYFKNIPIHFLGTGLKLVHPTIFDNCVKLAEEELRVVDKLDVDLIRENLPLLKLYYGASDGWVPVKYYSQLKEQIPNVDAQLDEKNIPHAFMLNLKAEHQLSELLAEWIKKNN